MTNTNTNISASSNGFNFGSKEEAIALYLDSVRSREAIEKELLDHAEYQSSICKAMLESFGTKDDITGKVSLQLDLGDGSPRGHIVVMRERKDAEPLYFVRERNTGRPVGSKNKTTKAASAAPVAEERPEIVSEGMPVSEPVIAAAAAEEESTGEEEEVPTRDTSKDETVAQVLASVGHTGDATADAILQVAQTAIEALKAHGRSVAPQAASAE